MFEPLLLESGHPSSRLERFLSEPREQLYLEISLQGHVIVTFRSNEGLFYLQNELFSLTHVFSKWRAADWLPSVLAIHGSLEALLADLSLSDRDAEALTRFAGHTVGWRLREADVALSWEVLFRSFASGLEPDLSFLQHAWQHEVLERALEGVLPRWDHLDVLALSGLPPFVLKPKPYPYTVHHHLPPGLLGRVLPRWSPVFSEASPLGGGEETRLSFSEPMPMRFVMRHKRINEVPRKFLGAALRGGRLILFFDNVMLTGEIIRTERAALLELPQFYRS